MIIRPLIIVAEEESTIDEIAISLRKSGIDVRHRQYGYCCSERGYGYHAVFWTYRHDFPRQRLGLFREMDDIVEKQTKQDTGLDFYWLMVILAINIDCLLD